MVSGVAVVVEVAASVVAVHGSSGSLLGLWSAWAPAALDVPGLGASIVALVGGLGLGL